MTINSIVLKLLVMLLGDKCDTWIGKKVRDYCFKYLKFIVYLVRESIINLSAYN